MNMPEVADINAKTGKEVLHAVDFDGEIYLRQERGGMLMGTYEKACVPWSEKDTPWEFGHQLLEPDIDRIAPSLEVGFQHFPAFEKAGIYVARDPSEIGQVLVGALIEAGLRES